MLAMTERFDDAYYARFYETQATQVHDAEQIAALARGITGMMQWWGASLRNVLDVGAGSGLMRDWFRANLPNVRYRSTEYSAYACQQFGHERRDISEWRAKQSFDLIVCQGVLPYLSDAACAQAIENLAAMSRGFLYLEAITKRDLEEVCDTELTDTRVHRRTRAWYLRHLKPHFVQVGAGLFAAHSGKSQFYELEALTQRS
jgi:2-polyprenyl-3-methyl-5-hydroxy-6-metoxy-1,4-benzoquinol methylase